MQSCRSFHENLTCFVGYQGCLWVINISTHKTPVCGIVYIIKISNKYAFSRLFVGHQYFDP